MKEKTRIIIKYDNNETQVIYSPIGECKLRRVFNDRVSNDSKWLEIDSFFIQMDKINSIEIGEY